MHSTDALNIQTHINTVMVIPVLRTQMSVRFVKAQDGGPDYKPRE